MAGVYRVLVGKTEGRRPLGRPRRTRKDNIKTNLNEVGCKARDWIDVAQYRETWRAFVNAVKNFRIPRNVGNFLTSSEPISF